VALGSAELTLCLLVNVWVALATNWAIVPIWTAAFCPALASTCLCAQTVLHITATSQAGPLQSFLAQLAVTNLPAQRQDKVFATWQAAVEIWQARWCLMMESEETPLTGSAVFMVYVQCC
jgi:hypothetical protein